MQCFHNACRSFGSQGFVAHGRYRTRQVVLLHLSVAHYDYLVEFLGVFGEGNTDGLLVAYCNLLGAVADIGEYEYIFGCYIRKSIVTVKIGDSTIGGAFYLNAHANQRLAVVVHYRTAYALLCIRQQARYR